MKMEFVHIVRSEYNFDSLIKINRLVEKTKKMGMKSVAIADYHTLYHVVDFIEQCKKQDIKPIVASKFNLKSENIDLPMTVFAKNNDGYKNIMKLSSISHLRNAGGLHITLKELKECKDDVILLVDLAELLASSNRNDEVIAEEVLHLRNIFHDDIYLEVKDFGLSGQKEINLSILSFANEGKMKVMASNDVSYLEKREEKKAAIIEAIRASKKVKEVNVKERYFKSMEEMMEMLPYAQDAVKNTSDLHTKCNLSIILKGQEGFETKNPEFAVPTHFKTLARIEHLFTPMKGFKLPKDEKKLLAISYLLTLAWKGLSKKYSQKNHIAIERLKYELGIVIGTGGHVDYFLVIQDLISYAKKNDIPCSVRGSVLSSLLARCLGITDICPLEYDLQFERFLNPQRSDEPDIDIDVSQKKRYQLIRYMQRKYGKSNVSQIITFGAYGLKNAVKYIGDVLEIDGKTVAKIADRIPKKHTDLSTKPELLEWARKDKKIKELIEASYVVAPLPRNTSRHAAGIILSGNSLLEEIPVWKESDAEGDILVSQFHNNNEQLEKLGFLKIDLLGLRNIDVVDETKKLVEQQKGIKIDGIPLDDEKTYELYRKGDLIGLFQVESEGMRQSSVMIQPSNINDVIALVALYRPGPKNEIKRYAENKKTNQVLISDESGNVIKDEALEGILEETYGILTYQEQINKIAQKMGGYTISEADILRRAVSKKKKEVMDEERKNFVKKSVENGYEERTANLIYDLIVRFADYGLNKAHAAGYAIFSYQTAWLKTNYPLEYMTALINSVIVGKKKEVNKAAEYIDEAKRMGIKVKNPDINDSFCDFVLKNETIHFGLSMVKNVGRGFAEQILAERENGLFQSFEDFIKRIGTNVAIESLIKVGAFDSFGKRKVFLEQFLGKKNESPYYTFADIPTYFHDDPTKEGKDYTLEEILQFEKELVCTYLTETPLESLKPILVDAENEKKRETKQPWIAGVVLEVKKHRTKKEQKEMAFIKAHTRHGEYDFTLFPEEWMKYRSMFTLFTPLLMKVKINKEKNSVSVLDVAKIHWKEKVFIEIAESEEETKKRMKGLVEILKKYPGEDDVTISVSGKEMTKKNSFKITKESLDDIIRHLGSEKSIKVIKSSV